MITIAVSSRSLFQLEDGNKIFMEEGQEAFNAYMRSSENKPLRKGVAFSLVRKLLSLNNLSQSKAKLVEIVMLSRNSPDAGMRVMNSIQHYGLDIERAVFSQGADRFKYAKAFGAQLFLSTTPADVKSAIDKGLAAATLLPGSTEHDDESDNSVRIAFDGDAVLFSAEADELYQAEGLDAFRASEVTNAAVPLGAGPFKEFLMALHGLQKDLPKENSPLRLGLITARGMPAHPRVLLTLRSWNIHMDEAAFAAGFPKGPWLEAFGADIFFDDTQRNIESARSLRINSGHVPFGSGQGIVSTNITSSSPEPELA